MKDKRLLFIDSEFGKIVVNECLKRGYFIYTHKLEKLLVIMHGKMLAEYNKPFLRSVIVPSRTGGIKVPQVDSDFLMYAAGFEEEIEEYVSLLDAQRKVIDQTLDQYGQMDGFDLEEKTKLHQLNKYCLENNFPVVPNDMIKEAFSHIIWEKGENSVQL